MHFLITAGPTREYLDPVRFISNASSGRMGLSIARTALRRGHQVTLIVGPIAPRLPQAARTIRVETTEQMAQACFKHFARTDCVIMSAAVADYQPVVCRTSKIKKRPGKMTLHLKPTTDILAELGRRKKRQLLIGFALETDQPRANALSKLKKKNLDYVVANSPLSLSSERIEATILSAAGESFSTGSVSKLTLARRLVLLGESHFDAPRRH
ncbi:MAG: hypothetical protein GWP14_03370 [Actinobacteria bacterium]|nr:hypothetical protein [Actinomycetota bacterium]